MDALIFMARSGEESLGDEERGRKGSEPVKIKINGHFSRATHVWQLAGVIYGAICKCVCGYVCACRRQNGLEDKRAASPPQALMRIDLVFASAVFSVTAGWFYTQETEGEQ